MSMVHIEDVKFLNNKESVPFLDDYKLQITFDCIAPLSGDIEWKLTYVSIPKDPPQDRDPESEWELESCLVGPTPQGTNTFEFDASAPDPHKIPPNDLPGVSVITLTASYNDQEFIRVGYYQNTEYKNEALTENPPDKLVFEDLVRDIIEKPRVTRSHINWDATPPGAGS